MTVRELIEYLDRMPPNYAVYFMTQFREKEIPPADIDCLFDCDMVQLGGDFDVVITNNPDLERKYYDSTNHAR